MNALTRPSSPDPRAETPPKAVLFCPSCDRRAPLSEWVVTPASPVDANGSDRGTADSDDAADAAGDVLTCPVCGETLTVRPATRE